MKGNASPSAQANDTVLDSVLFNDWHVVAKAEDLKPGTVMAARLLETDLVLWRGQNTQISAWEDRCPHRSIRLSGGWVESDTLVCPYHGLVYNAEGRCIKVPAHPNYLPPKQACVQTYQATERYGLIFVCLGEPVQEIAPFQEWDDPGYLKFLCGPHVCHSSGFRAIENFLDLAHFPFVHRGILGSVDRAEVHDYRVSVDERGVRFHDIRIWQPDPVGLGQGTTVIYNFWTFRPLVSYLQKQTPDGQHLTIWYCVTPVGETEFVGWMWLAMNFGDAGAIDQLQAFQDNLVQQDFRNLELHNPKPLPLNLQAEFHLPCDRGSLAYRKWLKDMGITYGVTQ